MKLIAKHCLLPIIIGSALYLLFKSTDLVFFRWFYSIGLHAYIQEIRNLLSGFRVYTPKFILNFLPDLLWAYSFTSAIAIERLNANNKPSYLSLSPLLIGVLLEFLQLINIVPGTFDVYDILAYFLGSFLSLYILNLNPLTMKKSVRQFVFPSLLVSVFVLFAIASGSDDSKMKTESSNSSSTSESNQKTETQKSTSATCSYCGKSFYKDSGFMLSGHPEVFCSQNCATNWGWQHNIGVN